MSRLLREIKFDANFIRSHSLQPKWYKVLKVFILVGFLAGYYGLFGVGKTAIFLAVFTLLSLAVHLLYRSGTKKFTQSWLDFVVVQEGNEAKPKSIGKWYYSFVVLNAALAVLVSQMLL